MATLVQYLVRYAYINNYLQTECKMHLRKRSTFHLALSPSYSHFLTQSPHTLKLRLPGVARFFFLLPEIQTSVHHKAFDYPTYTLPTRLAC